MYGFDMVEGRSTWRGEGLIMRVKGIDVCCNESTVK